MQFNTYIFVLGFLPIFILLYFITGRIDKRIGKYLLIISGLVFYWFAGVEACIVFASSSVVSLVLSLLIEKVNKGKKILLAVSIAANVGLLLFYKYLSFLAANAPAAEGDAASAVSQFVMPLGISFFTFQQIMYIVNVYKKEIDKVRITDYLAYITYFPKLLMGPLVEPVTLIEQINNPELKKINWDNIASGIKLFSFGLFKKLVLADTFNKAVAWGFGYFETATSGDLILTMLFYTFEIYFDFSGYTDMAIGVSKIVNIELPINFDSPYKALSIRDFWKRWHISLTTFFTKYIYFPLGGSKKGKIRTYVNIMIIFLISGVWHGASLAFVLWGVIHGLLQVLERLFDKYYNKLSEVVRWIYAFGAVNILWLLFRSETIQQWLTILRRILSFQDMSVSDGMIQSFNLPENSMLFDVLHLNTINENVRGFSMLIFILAGFIICLIPENNYKTQNKRNIVNMILAAIAFVWGFLCLGSESVFVYFGF